MLVATDKNTSVEQTSGVINHQRRTVGSSKVCSSDFDPRRCGGYRSPRHLQLPARVDSHPDHPPLCWDGEDAFASSKLFFQVSLSVCSVAGLDKYFNW